MLPAIVLHNPQHNSLRLPGSPFSSTPSSPFPLHHPRIQLAMGRVEFLPQLRRVLFAFSSVFFSPGFLNFSFHNRRAYISRADLVGPSATLRMPIKFRVANCLIERTK